jgi:hypothetical protein
MSTLAALCSLGFALAEATISWNLPNLSAVSAALRAAADAGGPLPTELLCFLFLAYPCACAYYSLYRWAVLVGGTGGRYRWAAGLRGQA